MPVSAPSPRINRHVAGPGAGPGVGPGRGTMPRRPGEPAALTVTVAIPLTNEALSPHAHKLIEAVRELVELSQGTVTVEPPAPAPANQDQIQPQLPAYAYEHAPTGPEVRLLTASRQVTLDGQLLPLTRLEFDLLLFLAERPRRVFTRGQLLTGVWGYEHTGERTVDVHVRRLRLKLGTSAPAITTVYGVGYRLSDEARVVISPHE